MLDACEQPRRRAKELGSMVVRATKALLDFLYVAQALQHSDPTLSYLETKLHHFHDNKQVFLDLQATTHFIYPKLHWLQHYPESVRQFGATDNTNTQATERLHIEYCSKSYAATNRKNVLQQMTKWVERGEKMFQLAVDMDGRKSSDTRDFRWDPLVFIDGLVQTTTKHPSSRALLMAEITEQYNATLFEHALQQLQVKLTMPALRGRAFHNYVINAQLPHLLFYPYHKIKFIHPREGKNAFDSIVAKPAATVRGQVIPARFDTAIVKTDSGGQLGKAICFLVWSDDSRIIGFRIARIKCMFEFARNTHTRFAPGADQASQLRLRRKMAYVEWYTKLLPASKDADSGLYTLQRAEDRYSRQQEVEIVDLADVFLSAHLVPVFGSTVPDDWTSDTVLDKAPSFLLNSFKERMSHYMLEYPDGGQAM